jgi:hypothetical protein
MATMSSSTGTASAAWTTVQLSAAINTYEAYGYRFVRIRVAADGVDPVNRVDFSYDGSAPAEDKQVVVQLAGDPAPAGKAPLGDPAKAFVAGKLKSVVIYR